MIKVKKAYVGIAFTMLAFAPASSADELGYLKKAPTKSQRLYIEGSFGWKGDGRQKWNSTGLNDASYDFSAGRWNETHHGTDMSINLGYYLRDDLRVSIGYKKIMEHLTNWDRGDITFTFDDHYAQTDAYVLNIYKDFPISNTRWTPYVGAGLGLANIFRSETSGYISGNSGAVYSQVMAGVGYSYKKIDLFGEISYGGTGTHDWIFTNEGHVSQQESLTNIAGSFGIRIRL